MCGLVGSGINSPTRTSFLFIVAMMLCHSAGPVRHFMELVVTGLSKNPFYTAKEKQEYVKWYRKYFSQFTPEELQAIPVTRIEPDTQQKWQKHSMLAVNLLLVVCTVISFVPMQATLQLFVACRTLSNEKLDWGSWKQRCGVVSSSANFVLILLIPRFPQEHVAGERRSCALPAWAYKSANVFTTAVSGVGEVRTAVGLPCLVCFARPDSWKHHSLWSVSAVTHNWGVP